jgi:hypothetical protein
MAYRLLADAVLVLHLAFILFAAFGALLVARRPRLLPWHLAAAVWGFTVEAAGAACPLTGLEIRLRLLAGEGAYGEGFIAHYLLPVVYPAGLDRGIQYLLAAAVLLLNVALYARYWRGAHR